MHFCFHYRCSGKRIWLPFTNVPGCAAHAVIADCTLTPPISSKQQTRFKSWSSIQAAKFKPYLWHDTQNAQGLVQQYKLQFKPWIFWVWHRASEIFHHQVPEFFHHQESESESEFFHPPGIWIWIVSWTRNFSYRDKLVSSRRIGSGARDSFHTLCNCCCVYKLLKDKESKKQEGIWIVSVWTEETIKPK